LNEYTRREEIRWTLATVFILVPAVAIAIVRLVLAQGPMVTNPTAITAEGVARQADVNYKSCKKAADKLGDEVELFLTRAEQAKKKAREEAEKDNRSRRKIEDKDLDVDIPWSAAAPVLKYAKQLHTNECRASTEAAVGKDDDASSVWAKIKKAAKVKDPGSVSKDQKKAALELLELFDRAPVDKLKAQSQKAQDQLAANAKKAAENTKQDQVRAPLPTGLFPRGMAIGVGVGVALAALIISYVSVRSASMRRGRTLVTLRRFANTPEAGLQAASIVRLAAHHNGGEPGMVIGSAVGGLIAALLSPTDNANIFIADLFVAGSMGGLLIGLAGQWLVRTLTGVSRWRERTKELGDIEKPTIPVALVLGGVTPGLEKQFLRYFEALPVADAATVVQKLAAQAEEQILAAADAAAHAQQQQPMHAAPGAWGGHG
jgi:hypothetical protein